MCPFLLGPVLQYALAIFSASRHSVSMPASRSFSLGAIILAAGRSSRMGRSKLLLPWGETTVLGHSLNLSARLPAAQVAVVHAPADAAIEAELNRLRFPGENRIVNPEPNRGMFSSVQCAARWPGWHATLTHWAIMLGDQPHLQPATLSALAEFSCRHHGTICQPSRRGHPRHPVLLPRDVFVELEGSAAVTLKEFLQSRSANVKCIEFDDPGLDLDLDTMADYQTALQLAFGDTACVPATPTD